MQIKGKIKSNWDKTHLGLSFWGELIRVGEEEEEKRREEKRRRRRSGRRRRRSQERYGNYGTCMEML